MIANQSTKCEILSPLETILHTMCTRSLYLVLLKPVFCSAEAFTLITISYVRLVWLFGYTNWAAYISKMTRDSVIYCMEMSIKIWVYYPIIISDFTVGVHMENASYFYTHKNELVFVSWFWDTFVYISISMVLVTIICTPLRHFKPYQFMFHCLFNFSMIFNFFFHSWLAVYFKFSWRIW